MGCISPNVSKGSLNVSLNFSGAPVRRGSVWIAEGTLPIMNNIIEIMFIDFKRGEGLVLISDDEDSTNTLKTRLDIIRKGDPPWIPEMTLPAVSHEIFLRSITRSPGSSYAQLHGIRGIQVMPTIGNPVLYVQLQGLEVFGARSDVDADDYLSGGAEYTKDATYSLCGILTSITLNLHTCHHDIWDEAERGHIIWLTVEGAANARGNFAVVPSGSLLSTGAGQVRIVKIDQLTEPVTFIRSLPFKSTTWTLTSGIPATTRELDFSMTTRALVRKTPRISQTGNATDTGFNAIKVFMTNDPSSPTHWLSQVRAFSHKEAQSCCLS